MPDSLIKMICHPGLSKGEGALCVAEGVSDQVPFEIKRVYYSYGVQKGIIRGYHAHKTLEQVLICVYGEIEVTLDNGVKSVKAILKDPSAGLYVGAGIWHVMKWQKDNSVLLVMASDHYKATDYMRDYQEFLAFVNQNPRVSCFNK